MNKITPIQLMTYFQSVIRNIGLFTSLSFGALAISRYHRDKIWFLNILLIIISIVFIINTIYIIHYLRSDIQKYVNLEEYKSLKQWMIIPDIMEYANYTLIITSVYILVKQI